jgi:hypothetical protein
MIYCDYSIVVDLQALRPTELDAILGLGYDLLAETIFSGLN